MTDTAILAQCPFCGSIDIKEQREVFTTTIRVDKPGAAPEKGEIKIYVCGQCGRTFNELEEGR